MQASGISCTGIVTPHYIKKHQLNRFNKNELSESFPVAQGHRKFCDCMFSGDKHRRGYVFLKVHFVGLQGAVHSAEGQRSQGLSSNSAQLLLQQQHLCWANGILFACCTQPLLSEAGDLNTVAQVRLDQSFSAAAAQLEHLLQPKWGMGGEKGNCIALNLGSGRLIWKQ